MSREPLAILQLLLVMKVEVSHYFNAPIEAVWALLSDVERMAGLGPEHVEAHWLGQEIGVGAQFSGRNRRGDWHFGSAPGRRRRTIHYGDGLET